MVKRIIAMLLMLALTVAVIASCAQNAPGG